MINGSKLSGISLKTTIKHSHSTVMAFVFKVLFVCAQSVWFAGYQLIADLTWAVGAGLGLGVFN